MKKLNHIGIFLVCLFITIQSFASEPIRVACIGNSITYGAFIPNREMNCYPAQLQAYLGDGYEVKNFGASGRTILSKGDYPYSETDTYKASLEYQPDIVLIKLGTNDTKPQNWKYKNEFKDNYQTLITSTYYSPDSYPLFPAGGFGNQCTTDRKRGTPHGGRIGLEKSTGNYQSV